MSRRREVAADTRAPGKRLAHVLEVGLQARMQATRLTPFPKAAPVEVKRGPEEPNNVTNNEMLPRLDRLRLYAGARAPAPTDGFVQLTHDEVDELNSDGGDPLFFEEFVKGCPKDGDEDYHYPCEPAFRVWLRDDMGRKGKQSKVYRARDLWDWVGVQEKKTDPLTRQPFWRQDWMELRDKYAPGMKTPLWVRYLPLLEEALPPHYQQLNKERENSQTLYYAKSDNRKLRVDHKRYGELWKYTEYEGAENYEALRKSVLVTSDGVSTEQSFYKGDPGEEHLVREVGVVGDDYFARDNEDVARIDQPNDTKYEKRYVGKKGEEALIRTETDLGVMLFKPRRNFRLPVIESSTLFMIKYKMDATDVSGRILRKGDVAEYAGEYPNEALWRLTYADGSVELYAGPSKKEVLVATMPKLSGRVTFVESTEEDAWVYGPVTIYNKPAEDSD